MECIISDTSGIFYQHKIPSQSVGSVFPHRLLSMYILHLTPTFTFTVKPCCHVQMVAMLQTQLLWSLRSKKRSTFFFGGFSDTSKSSCFCHRKSFSSPDHHHYCCFIKLVDFLICIYFEKFTFLFFCNLFLTVTAEFFSCFLFWPPG